MKKIIATTNAPAAIGPYSQAIDCGIFFIAAFNFTLFPPTHLLRKMNTNHDTYCITIGVQLWCG